MAETKRLHGVPQGVTKRKHKDGVKNLVNAIAVLTIILAFILVFRFCDWVTEPKYCTVTNAEYKRELGTWKITIRDREMEFWSYYGDYQTEGSHIYPIWSENGNEIVGIK